MSPFIRVLSGEKRNMKMRIPAGRVIRPTLGRVKKTVFDILGSSVVGARVLDLFAGTGNLGIEALSIGARHVTFVENDPRISRMCVENLRNLGFGPERYRVVTQDAEGFLRGFDEKGFSLIFIDPPYRIRASKIEAIFREILERNALSEGGEIIFFMSKKRVGEFDLSLFRELTRRKIGITEVVFLGRP